VKILHASFFLLFGCGTTPTLGLGALRVKSDRR
jgi:hypothetical protein